MPPKREPINFYTKMDKKLIPNRANPQFDDHHINVPFRMMIVGASGSMKTNTLLNLIDTMHDTFSSIWVICKNTQEPLYQHLAACVPSRQFHLLEGLDKTPYLDSDNFKINDPLNHLVVFDDMITEPNLSPIKEFFIRGRKYGVSTVFISQSYFGSGDKAVAMMRRNLTHIILKRVSNLGDLTRIKKEYSLSITDEEFVRLYQHCTRQREDWLMIDCEAEPEDKFRFDYDAIDPLTLATHA
jgi:hypothetical protein